MISSRFSSRWPLAGRSLLARGDGRPAASATWILVLLFVARAQAQQFGERVEVHAIEVSANVRDASGNVPADLRPEDFILLEDGKPRRIIGVEATRAVVAPAVSDRPPPRQQQLVVFIQQSLSTTAGLRQALQSLASQAERLVDMGEVEVVTDAPRPHALFAPTRDAVALRTLLETLAKDIVGDEELIRMRMAFKVADPPPAARDDATAAVEMLARSDQVRMRARREWTRLRSRQDAMLAWLSRYPRRALRERRALVFVSDGFDLDPAAFYALDPSDGRAARRNELRELDGSAHHDAIAQALSAQGWTILSLAAAPPVDRVTRFESQSHEARPPLQFVNVLGSTRHNTINRAPLAPLLRLADATGGSVLTDTSQLGAQLEELDQRVVITYQVDRAADDTLRRIEIRPVRAGLTIHAQKWIGTSGTGAIADASSAALATTIAAAEETERGELPVTCSITLGPSVKGVRNSEVEVRVDLSPIEEDLASVESGTLRFTLAVVTADGKPFTSTRRLEHLDLASKNGWACAIAVRHRDGAKMAVIAAEASTGTWGACAVRP